MVRRSPLGALLLLVCLQPFFSMATGSVVAGIAANGRPVPQGDTINVCQGSTISFQSVGQGSLNITWRFQQGTGGTTGSGIGPFNIVYNTPGFDSVFQKITDGTDADSTWLIVRVSDQRPTAGFSWTPNNDCGNVPIQFTNNSAGDNLISAWTFGDGGTSTVTNPAYPFLKAIGVSGTQNYNVNLMVTNTYGCSNTINQMVTVKNTPDASIGNADAGVLFGTFNGNSTFKKCNNIPSYVFSFTNQSTTTAINTGYTIQWGDGTPDSAFVNWVAGVVIKHTFPLGGSTMTVKVTGTNGCTGIKQYIVFLGSTPAGGLASLGNTDICASDSLRFVLNNVSGNPPGTLYTFLINDGSSAQVFQHPPPAMVGHFFGTGSCGFVSSSGNSTFNNSFGAYLTIENPCGTTSPSVVPIYVSGKPRASIYVYPSKTVCTNSPVVIESTSTYGSVITATGGTGSTCTNSGIQVWAISPATGYTISSGSMGSLNGNPGNGLLWTGGSANLFVSFNKPGTYTVKIYVFNNRCGMDSTFETICVRNPPQASFTLPKHNNCGPLDLQLTNTSPIGTCGGDVYQWVVTYQDPLGCGSSQGTPYAFANGTDANSYSPLVHLSAAGKYIFHLTVTGLNAGIACSPAIYTDTFTVIGTPKVNLQPLDPICTVNTVSPSARIDSCYSPGPFTYDWEFTGGQPASAGVLVPGTVGYAAVGSYPYLLTVTDSYCATTVTATGQISVTPPPVAAAGNDTAVCSGAHIRIGAAGVPGVVYQWTPATGLSDPTAANPVLSAVYSGTSADTVMQYTVVASPGSLCSSSDMVQITVRRTPVVSVKPSLLQLCIGDTLQMVATGADTYSWTPAVFKSNTGADTVVVKPAVSTTYVVIGQLSWGCADTVSLPVAVRPDSKALFAASNTTVCSGISLTDLITVTTDATANGRYDWWDNSSLIGSNTSGVFPGLSIRTPGEKDTLKLVTTSPFGCKADSMQVVFFSVPSVTAHFTKSGAEGCGPLRVLFNNDSSPVVSGQFFWDFGNGQRSDLAQPDSVSFLPSPWHRDTTYVITLKAYNGCDTTIWQDSVKVFPDPKAAFTLSRILGCSPFTDTLINLSEGNNTYYIWDFGDGTNLATGSYANLTHTWHTGVIDTFTISLTATNRCGSRTDSLDIVVSPNVIRPGIQLNGNSLFGCAPFTATFVNNSSGAAQIIADFKDGSNPIIVAGDQATISHQYLRPGVFVVNMRLTNFCTDTSVSLTVNVFAAPVPAFSIKPNPVCTGNAIFATNLSVNGNSFRWNWGDSTLSDLDSGRHVYNKGGDYMVQLTAALVNNFGTVCTVTSQPVTIQVVDLIPALIDTGDNRPCTPYNMTVMAKNAADAAAINWTFYDASRSGGNFQSAGQTASYQYNSPGTYSVRLIVQNIAGCSDTAIHSFTVSATPQLLKDPFGPIYTCNTDTTLTLAGAASYNGTGSLTWSWLINGQVAGAGNPLNYRFHVPDDSLQPVNYAIREVATNDVGCADTTTAGTLVIRPLPPPHVVILPDSIIYQPDYTFTFLDSILRVAGMRYTWDFGDNNGENSGREVVHKYGDTGTYVVISRIADEVTGCKKEDTTHVKIVYVPGFLYVPSAICPGCSVAELRAFLPKGRGLKEYHLRIYNAWGQMIFETTKLDGDGAPVDAWNAQWNGQKVQQDAYRWQIEARYINGTEWKGMVFPNQSAPVKSGFITVVR